jgi:CHAT domain-containing protein
VSTPVSSWRLQWQEIAGVGAWLLAIVSGFLIPPPLGALQSGDSVTWSRFSQFVVTLFVGLLLVFTRRWSHVKYETRWIIAAVASVVLSVASFLIYVERSAAWSCYWGDTKVVVGDILNNHGRTYKQANPNLTCDQIVWNHAGQVERVWTRASIDDRRNWLGRLYLLLPALFATAIILTLHARGSRSTPAPPIVGPAVPIDRASVNILFLAANPATTSRLDLEEELHALEQELRGVRYRDSIKLTAGHAVRPDDLLRLVREKEPTIVHFSGHGSTAGIIVRNDAGGDQAIDGTSLHRFFQGRGVDLVVLNSCYSKTQADAIGNAVKAVVGTTAAVGDQAARRFTVAFYRSLGNGLSVREAFRDGSDAVVLHQLKDVFHSSGQLDLIMVKPPDNSEVPAT